MGGGGTYSARGSTMVKTKRGKGDRREAILRGRGGQSGMGEMEGEGEGWRVDMALYIQPWER